MHYPRLLTLTCFVFVLFTINAQNNQQFEHAMWQWVEGSNISDKRMNEVAPHFPHPSDSDYNMESYDLAIYRWQKLYCFEYEALINAPELTALNPYYTEYQDIIKVPYFIRPLSSFDKPVRKDTGNPFEDDLNYELDIQAWYFVFEPDEFQHRYKIDPDFSVDFDAEAYRFQVIKKIEETEKQKSLNNVETN